MKKTTDFDVIIIGGSYAGLSAAMSLGRSMRHVLIIDSGQPCNRYTPHSHNFITHDGAKPAEIASIARAQVLQYPTIEFHSGLAKTAIKQQQGFHIELETGAIFTARKIIVATGIRDLLPEINGFTECWGKSIIHCPYCHGYEFRGKKTGIMATAEQAIHMASLINNLTDNLTLLTAGKPNFSPDNMAKLKAHNINIEEQKVVSIDQKNGHINSVGLADGRSLPLDVLYAALPFQQSSNIPADLGCELTEAGHIKVDFFQQTTIDGLLACGDCSSMMRSLAAAVATGNIAGVMANHHLIQEDF